LIFDYFVYIRSETIPKGVIFMNRISNVVVGRNSGELVVSQSRPVISWRILGDGPDVRQDSYEVQVASDKEFTKNVSTSGIIKSSSVIQAQWPANSLKSRETRYVRVKSLVNSSWTEWSTPTEAEAPLFSNKEWKALPITLPNDPGTKKMAPPSIFRKEFTITSLPTKSRLYVTSQGLFDISINGKLVSNELFNPGWTSYRFRIAYCTYDVSSFLKIGENVISMVVADGWYRGQLTWEQWRNIFGEKTTALAQLEMQMPSGEIEKVLTDKSWKVNTGEIRSADIYDGVNVDYRNEHTGWRESGFNDSAWVDAQEVSAIRALLYPMSSQPVRVTEKINPVTENKTSEGSIIYDFGQNMAGHLRIKVKGKSGESVKITHAEVLLNGKLHRALLRTAKAEDNFILSGENEIEITPNFTFHGFRYAEILTSATIVSVIAEAINSDIPRIGHFKTSNPLLNKLHENTMWSQRANFVSVPTDCPQRDERLGWTGDVQAFAPTASTIFDCENFFSSWLIDVAIDQQPDGGVTNFAPDVPGPGSDMFGNTVDLYGGRAGWGDAATIVPWALYEAYGDKETLRVQHHSMVRWVDYLESKCAPDGLIPDGEFQFGDWLDPDAPADKPWDAKCDSTYLANAFSAFSARLLSRASEVTGHQLDAKKYSNLSDEFNLLIWKKWKSEILTTATGCASAIELEVAPEAERAMVAQALVNLVEAAGGKISTGFLGTPLVMSALSKHGHFDSAYKLLLNEEVPGWLYQIKNGATSMWERWDAILPDGSFQSGDLEGANNSMISFNHYAYGAVTAWMYRNVAGISPSIEKPGYEEIIFAPRPHASISWAEASIDTRFGKASIRWEEKSEGEYEAKIEIPAGSYGLFISEGGKVKERLGSGKHSLIFKVRI
jgi:alpha-L-rhamnosidase